MRGCGPLGLCARLALRSVASFPIQHLARLAAIARLLAASTDGQMHRGCVLRGSAKPPRAHGGDIYHVVWMIHTHEECGVCSSLQKWLFDSNAHTCEGLRDQGSAAFEWYQRRTFWKARAPVIELDLWQVVQRNLDRRSRIVFENSRHAVRAPRSRAESSV